MSKIIMALDQGTTSSRSLLIEEDGHLLASASAEFDCHYPQDGWVEQDPLDLWETQFATMQAVVKKAGIAMSEVHAIGIIVKFINNCTFLILCVKLSGVFVSLVSTSLNADS